MCVAFFKTLQVFFILRKKLGKLCDVLIFTAKFVEFSYSQHFDCRGKIWSKITKN